MEQFLKRFAWAVGIVGVASVAFGLAILMWPSITISIMIKAFAILALVQGTAMAVSALVNHRESSTWVLSLVWGVLAILAGLYLFSNPHVGATVLLFVIASYALVRGVVDIAIGVALREQVNEWIYIIGGGISLVFGLYIFTRPEKGATALVWLIGIYAVLTGVLYVTSAFAFRALSHEVTKK